MATSVFSRPNQARRSKRQIVDQHPSNATLVPDEPDDDFRPISVAPSNASGLLRSPHPGSYPIFDDLLPSNVSELGAPSARGYHTTSQFREKPLHAPSPSRPQKKPTLTLKGVGKMLRRTFSRKHASAPPPTTKRVPSQSPSTRPSFHNPNQFQVSKYPIHSASPSPTPTVQATEVMDVNIPYEDTHPSPFASPQSGVTPHEDYTIPQQHTSALGRRATAPAPRRRRSSQSIRSFASSEPASLSYQRAVHPHTPRVHPAGPIDPNHPGSGTRLFVPPAAAAAAPVPQRKRIFTGPWYNRRGDMWIGVGPGPGDFRTRNADEMTFHPNFQHFPSEYGHFMNADGDVMDAVALQMIRRSDG
jgi:hypothetical protein